MQKDVRFLHPLSSRPLKRRQFRVVQDLVAVGVSDAVDNLGVHQCALDGMVGSPQVVAKIGECGRQRSKPPGSIASTAASESASQSPALFLLLASVNSKVPFVVIKESRSFLPEGSFRFDDQWNRPAIIR